MIFLGNDETNNRNTMKQFIYLTFLIPCILHAQKNQIPNKGTEFLSTIPFENGQVVYEKVFQLDSIYSKDKVFNSAKASLIKNTNYKSAKIDVDRESGNLSTEINYNFNAKPGIAVLTYNAKGLLSIDVREKKFRVRLMNNTATWVFQNVPFNFDIPTFLESEKKLVIKNKWKEEKSVLVPWDALLRLIVDAVGIEISKNLADDF